MTVYSLGQVSAQNNGARIIDSNHFASVVLGNPNAVTIGSTKEAGFDDAISYLGVTAIRWPGGSEAERSFDWTTDASSTHALDVSDLRNAIDYCANNGLSFSFTFPTSEFQRMSGAEIDVLGVDIAEFINNLLEYADQRNVVIDSIKIGNEYDLNGLSAEAYGQIASRLSSIVGETLHGYESDGDDWSRPDLVIESGRIWLQENQSGSFFGDRDHNGIKDAQEIADAFNTIEAEYVDAVDIHSMTLFLSSYEDYFGEGAYSNASLNAVYDSLNSFWDDTFQDVELQTLAWQYPWRRDVDGPDGPGGVEDHGGSALTNASLGFMHYYEMSLAGVGYAASWQAAGWGSASPTLYHNEPRAGGEIFRLMQENISGLRAIEFDHDPTVYQNDNDIEDVVFRAFEQHGNVVLYIGNLETESQTITIDDVLGFLRDVNGFDSISSLNDISHLHVWGTRLGVEGNPSDPTSATQIEVLNLEDLLSDTDSDGSLEFSLEAHEIMQLSFTSSEHNMMEMHGGNQEDTLRGRDGDDTLYGHGGDDDLRGAGGRDALHGGTGADTLQGGSNSDWLYGDAGNDVLLGENGHDRIYGGTGDDWLVGGNGDDWLVGGNGGDTLYGGAGVDNLRGNDGDDMLFGHDGDDDLRGASGRDALHGGTGADTLQGGSNSDWLYGDAGNDVLLGGNGGDTLYGGAGDDLLIGSNGEDTLYGGAGVDNLRGDDGDDTLYGHGGDDDLRGAGGRDALHGGTGADTLRGGSNSDRLYGDAGNDVLLGENGHDRIYGGTGDDWLVGGDGGDRLYGGAGSDNLRGDDGNDVLRGGDGGDTLYGDAGVDNLRGGGGNDTMTGGNGNDRFIFNSGFGNDTITDFDVSGSEALIFSNNSDIGSMADLTITYGVSDTVITFGSDSITLEGSTVALQIDDFIF